MTEMYQIYECSICGYRYDEEAGEADFDIEKGTKFESFSDQWRCPECGCYKEHFVLVLD